MIEEGLRNQKTIDYVETPPLGSVQTSLFLFACYYFGLDKHNKARFLLRDQDLDVRAGLECAGVTKNPRLLGDLKLSSDPVGTRN